MKEAGTLEGRVEKASKLGTVVKGLLIPGYCFKAWNNDNKKYSAVSLSGLSDVICIEIGKGILYLVAGVALYENINNYLR